MEIEDATYRHHVDRQRAFFRRLPKVFKRAMFLKTLQRRFHKSIARKQAEQRVVRLLCGDHPPEKTIVGWGDAKVVGTKQLRDAAIRAGVLVVPINEFHTSKLCSGCHRELKSFPSHRSTRARESAESHGECVSSCAGVLRSPSPDGSCILTAQGIEAKLHLHGS